MPSLNPSGWIPSSSGKSNPTLIPSARILSRHKNETISRNRKSDSCILSSHIERTKFMKNQYNRHAQQNGERKEI